MGFSDLKTEEGRKQLEGYLASRSYIEGYEPSQADVSVFKGLGSEPSRQTYPHAARWYRHIAYYTDSHTTLPGDGDKGFSSYGPSALGPAGAREIEADSKAAEAEADEDDIDLFGDDDDEVDEEAEKLKAQRLAEYEKKKAGKTKPAAKSVVTFEVKPWDDETDMKELEENVRKIELDGLVWGASKLVAVGFGIKKLQITVVVEDDKISLDDLQEKVQEDEDRVQSTDIAAMQKL